MTTIIISLAVITTMFFKTIRRQKEPEVQFELISLDINPRWVSHTVFERSQFTQNQREAIAILEAGNIKMFNDFCGETNITAQQRDECLSAVTINSIV